MLQQTVIPRTPEEFAMCLNRLSENGRCVVAGFILGMGEREHLTAQTADTRPSA